MMDEVWECYRRLLRDELEEIKNEIVSKISVELASISLSFNSKLLLSLVTTQQQNFRNGDLAAIVDTKNTELLRGVVYSADNRRIQVSIDKDEIDLPSPIYLVKLQDESTYNRLLQTIDKYDTIDQSNQLNPLMETIFGLRKPTFFQESPSEYLDNTLNQSQRDAVNLALKADHLALIHGPPGTGKSYTLIEIIRQLINQDKRILVCGSSNLAVDNILERLSVYNIPVTRLGHPARILNNLQTQTLEYQTSHSHQNEIVKDVKKELEDLMKDLKDGRIKGKLKRKNAWNEVKELRKEHRKRSIGVLNSLMTRAKVVLCTLHGAGGRQLQHQKEFDVCVIDESTQALEPSCLIPVLKAKKLILAGDPLQLPPTVLARPGQKKKERMKIIPKEPKTKKEKEISDKLAEVNISEHGNAASKISRVAPTQPTLKPLKSLEESLFERLIGIHGNSIKCLLSVQYRMHDMIMKYPSEAMYNSKLTAYEAVSKRTLMELPNVADNDTEKDEVELSSPLVFIDTDGYDFFERIDSEELKKGAVEEGSKYNENEVEIIKRKVQDLVHAGVRDSQIAIITPYQAQVGHLNNAVKPQFPGCEIGSVDGVQGREQEVVIMSLVRSNETGEVGFLKEERRLNVAMTRAKRQLIIVGNSATIKRGSNYLKKWMDFLESNADIQVPE
ncbi:P-loop containing nucleoside triphosphate hydrolase protein [Wallemia mellicola]|uniref:P-loop containing nucleoside triphosphate hydrolase protein n=2 Tax=Wallemia mellicola TaxID=1708541 RepID=A0AB38N2Z5_9BASI|nr:P-loop containing nucleoside triphosphate hydrolase protein [Wallemia mellicola]TIC47315.1 P-loop containing nucleoside triphosphate hydrolase protein [Wallemia mellicola]TIC71407.1 P-loop containing nucleoside triphosphate hydrolase protein [Wallemia mellicola]TIC76244.1 P-loop containing nucleoside triphosphate hydrolase protein [Wallemia mellicola]